MSTSSAHWSPESASGEDNSAGDGGDGLAQFPLGQQASLQTTQQTSAILTGKRKRKPTKCLFCYGDDNGPQSSMKDNHNSTVPTPKQSRAVKKPRLCELSRTSTGSESKSPAANPDTNDIVNDRNRKHNVDGNENGGTERMLYSSDGNASVTATDMLRGIDSSELTRAMPPLRKFEYMNLNCLADEGILDDYDPSLDSPMLFTPTDSSNTEIVDLEEVNDSDVDRDSEVSTVVAENSTDKSAQPSDAPVVDDLSRGGKEFEGQVASEQLTCVRQNSSSSEPTSSTNIEKRKMAFGIGSNDYGLIGQGPDVLGAKSLVQIIGGLENKNVIQLKAGGMHSVCLTETGEVFTWGINDDFALGVRKKTTGNYGENDNEDSGVEDEVYWPMPISPSSPSVGGPVIKQVSAGDCHTAALRADGRVFVWGTFRLNNGARSLTTDLERSSLPVDLGVERIVKIVSGAEHLVMMSAYGQLFACGQGQCGQLGCRPPVNDKGNDYICCKPIGIRPNETVGDDNNHDDDSTTVVFRDVWAGHSSTFALAFNESYDIYACGNNSGGQLGIPEQEKFIYALRRAEAFQGQIWTVISPGESHTLALNASGQLFAIGRNEHGELGLGKGAANSEKSLKRIGGPLQNIPCTDISTAKNTSFATTILGQVYTWGSNILALNDILTADDATQPTDAEVYEPIELPLPTGYRGLKVSTSTQFALVLAERVNTDDDGIPYPRTTTITTMVL